MNAAGPPQILLVDDNPSNLKLLTVILKFHGHTIHTALNAEDAEIMIAASSFDLILTDIELPGMDGLTFTKKLKTNEKTRHIPIVAVTAFAMRGDDIKALNAGCDGYISKPIDVSTVGSEILKYLSGSDRSP